MAAIKLLLDNTLLETIDEVRGKQPRISWIRDAIVAHIRTANESLPLGGGGGAPKGNYTYDAPRGTPPPLRGAKREIPDVHSIEAAQPTAEFLAAKARLRKDIIEDCRHPVTRLIGHKVGARVCGACGKDGL